MTSPTSPLRSIDDILAAIGTSTLVEHIHTNLELKEDWDVRMGDKLSALANKITELVCFLVIGIDDKGNLSKKTSAWAKKTEEIISQHINNQLDPIQSCSSIQCKEIGGTWIIIVTIKNVGEVAYWNGSAYAAAGTTLTKMEPEEALKLRLQLPGLFDFSRQHVKSNYQPDLVAEFTGKVKEAGHLLEIELVGSKENSTLSHLGILERQASRLLFGNCPVRIIRYSASGDVIENREHHGLFRILRTEFINELCAQEHCGYSAKALKEALANAVAHAAYFERDGEVMLEIYPDRIVISNLCIRESLYFANRWFSRSHKTVNGLLMESLRVARLVDELGRGKHIIFSESIRLGHPAPKVIIEQAGKYNRWKLTIYGGNSDQKYLRLLKRSQEIYQNDRKALIAQALVLWRDLPVKEIKNFVDDEFAEMFAEVLGGFEGPIYYDKSSDKVLLLRWARVLLGEGKDSKALSPGEEESLYNRLSAHCTKHESGFLTPKMVRTFAWMGESSSERTLSSTILANWADKRWVDKVGHGRYKIVDRHAKARDLSDLLELFRTSSGKAAGTSNVDWWNLTKQ